MYENGVSLMTPVGVIEGEILQELETLGATTIRQLVRKLDWPASLVIMAIGALIRAGLVCGRHHELEIVVRLPNQEGGVP